MDLFDVIYSVRAQRKFFSKPVPDSMISQLLDAAIRAPSAGNRQEWLFVIVQDSEQRRKIAAIYEKASVAIMGFYRQRGKQCAHHLPESDFLCDHTFANEAAVAGFSVIRARYSQR
jgi:nitroreductase